VLPPQKDNTLYEDAPVRSATVRVPISSPEDSQQQLAAGADRVRFRLDSRQSTISGVTLSMFLSMAHGVPQQSSLSKVSGIGVRALRMPASRWLGSPGGARRCHLFHTFYDTVLDNHGVTFSHGKCDHDSELGGL